jgi:hypothetical protein
MLPQPSTAHVRFGHTPHTLAAPDPPHVSPAVWQVPQSSCPPQPSLIVPQLVGPQLRGVHTPQMLAVPDPPHVSPAFWQVPQSSVPPQPSPVVPQFFPCAAQVVGRQHLLP